MYGEPLEALEFEDLLAGRRDHKLQGCDAS